MYFSLSHDVQLHLIKKFPLENKAQHKKWESGLFRGIFNTIEVFSPLLDVFIAMVIAV